MARLKPSDLLIILRLLFAFGEETARNDVEPSTIDYNGFGAEANEDVNVKGFKAGNADPEKDENVPADNYGDWADSFEDTDEASAYLLEARQGGLFTSTIVPEHIAMNGSGRKEAKKKAATQEAARARGLPRLLIFFSGDLLSVTYLPRSSVLEIESCRLAPNDPTALVIRGRGVPGTNVTLELQESSGLRTKEEAGGGKGRQRKQAKPTRWLEVSEVRRIPVPCEEPRAGDERGEFLARVPVARSSATFIIKASWTHQLVFALAIRLEGLAAGLRGAGGLTAFIQSITEKG